MSKTRNKNRRHRRRNGMNIFWLVLSTDKGCNRPILFSREPHQHPETTYREWYDDGWKWISWHGTYYPPKDGVKYATPNKYKPIKVKLELCDDNPDMYIQRYKDCLFISSFISSYRWGGDGFTKLHYEVPHSYRISNKLFPEVTEKSGIVGIKIVPFDN